MDPAKKQVYARILETRNNITGSKNVSNQINTVMTPKIMTSMNVTVPTFMQHPTAVLELQPNFNAISKTKKILKIEPVEVMNKTENPFSPKLPD